MSVNSEICTCMKSLDRIQHYRDIQEQDKLKLFDHTHLDMMDKALKEKLVVLKKDRDMIDVLELIVRSEYHKIVGEKLGYSEAVDFIKELPETAINIGQLYGFDSKEMREIIILRIKYLDKQKQERLFNKSTVSTIKNSEVL